jgi:hypothetical protein
VEAAPSERQNKGKQQNTKSRKKPNGKTKPGQETKITTGENRYQTQTEQTNPVQKMGWAPTDSVERGWASDNGSRPKMEDRSMVDRSRSKPDPKEKMLQKGVVREEKRQMGKERRPGLDHQINSLTPGK